MRKRREQKIQSAQRPFHFRTRPKGLAHGSIEPVQIERLGYADVIRRYDHADALFYLDPPYDETTGYGTGFGRDDYVAMAAQLATIAGSFIMSINDTPFIRETFAAFEIQEVETTWTISTKAPGTGAKVTELIIRSRPA
ncbi:DNA adenine methylase [Sphingomonas aerolata]|uniref:DNA adenine methylase n=1 Tax=Sphingomonas aerolata TaxID=185951 RepID=UPI00334BBFB8